MNHLFSICIPTKNRVQNIQQVVDSVIRTASNLIDIQVVFYVDEDDFSSIEFIKTIQELDSTLSLIYVTGGKDVLFSDMWNKCAQVSDGEYLMLCGDDVEFKTNGWDKIVSQRFDEIPDKIAYITVKDGYQNGALGVHGFVSKKWIELTGFFTPPYFAYWYADTWLDEVSKMINRYIYLDNVEVIHYHPATENSRGTDAVYIENNSKITKELIASYENRRDERVKQSITLQYYIDTFSEQEPNTTKEINKKLSILICSIFSREKQFKSLMEDLKRQVAPFKDEVEILYEVDDAKIPIGTKRNNLLNRSNGLFVVFIDDDDTVHEKYVELILNAIEQNPNVDCIGFRGKILYANDWFIFSNSTKQNFQNINLSTKEIHDNISHINPIKRSIATKFRFPDRFWGEDAGWLTNVRSLLKTEYFLSPLMYIYTPSKEDYIKKEFDLRKN